jgi:hypothetical protein
MTALVLVVVIAAVGLAIDIGAILKTRTTLQKNADAMALAGAQELCGTATCQGAADTVARAYGVTNGVTADDGVTITFGQDCDGDPANVNTDLITVEVTRNQPSFFARVVGFAGGDVKACATARKFAIGSLSGARPFALEDNCIEEIEYGEVVVLKHDSDTTRTCDAFLGNFGTLDLDSSGGMGMRDDIAFGSDETVCADSVPGCTSYTFDTLTGDQIGNVKLGLKYVDENTPAACDTWAEVVTGGATDDEKINPDCNPWRPSYAQRYGADAATRLWVIPIVDGLWDAGGSHEIVIKGFAVVFWAGRWQDCNGGNTCDIEAIFVEQSVNVPGVDLIDWYDGATAAAVVLVK